MKREPPEDAWRQSQTQGFGWIQRKPGKRWRRERKRRCGVGGGQEGWRGVSVPVRMLTGVPLTYRPYRCRHFGLKGFHQFCDGERRVHLDRGLESGFDSGVR